jgi:peptide/nickel transport system ATP-binding protein
MLLITHDLRLASHVCDDIAVLYAGEQVEYGQATEVLRRSRHPYTWALDHATPDVHGPQRQLPALAGQMPGVSTLGGISGCRFAAHGSAAGACGARQRPLGALHLSARGRGSHADGGR